mmetsp:Transcript_3212/g.5045  ORF Transcript_3212/g.5045 Transcript_3212/m.5045 type:complete len:259 (-) Transcript_3212:185-961(-)
MSMYGYRGYTGIDEKCRQALTGETSTNISQIKNKQSNKSQNNNNDESDDEDENPLAQLCHWIEGDSLAPPCGSEIEAIHAMLEMANLKELDVLYDLGCGDGRVCLEAFAPPFGVRKCVGVDIEEDLIARFDELITEIPKEYFFLDSLPPVIKSGEKSTASTVSTTCHGDPVRVIQAVHADLRNVELDEATVICMYLLPEALAIIEDKLVMLLKANKGLRLLCNSWRLSSLEASDSVQVLNASIYLYTHESVHLSGRDS